MIAQKPVLKKAAGLDLPHVIYAKDQPEYLQLPTLRGADESGCVTSRWKLSWPERLRILLTGDLWLQVLTFHDRLQPVKILVKEPPIEECL